MAFQSVVNIYEALGMPGELSFDGPIRSKPYNLYSAGVPNVVGYAYTTSSNANPDNTTGSPNAGTAQVGGTGFFAGILVNPKAYSSNGVTGNPLGATLVLPDYFVGELLTMGEVFVNLPGPANSGDIVTYDPLTGALNSIAPTVSFTGAIAAGGASTEDVLTVSAITAGGTLGVGSLINAAGVLPGTYIASLGTGKGGTGTYNLTSINLQTVSSEAMTANNVPAPAFAASVASIAGTTLTITTLTSGEIRVGQQIYGTGILPNTVVIAYGSGVGGTGTYTVNNTQTVGPIALTGPANLIVPRAVVGVWGATSGVASIKLTD